MSGILNDRTIVITGSGSGIGLGILRAVVAEGARVYGIDNSDLSEQQVLKAGGTFLRADVCDTDALNCAIRRARIESGRLDGLVNNAGMTLAKSFLEADVAMWDQLWQTNQRSVLIACQTAARVMVEDGRSGSLVNLASVHATASDRDHESYAGTKGAIVAMGRSMAWSLGPHAIRVNTLSPGLTLTERVAEQAADPDRAATFYSWHATGRISTVKEIAGVAVFLLSDASSALTGSEIVADQGTTARLCNLDPRRSHD